MVGTREPTIAEDGSYRTHDQLDLRESTPAVLGRIRRWLRDRLVGLPHDPVDDLVLAADELVSNAFEHGDGPAALRISRSDTPCVVRLEVTDRNHRPVTVGHSRFGRAAKRGRGLVLVTQVSRAWGVDCPNDKPGKTVWAEISCDEG